MKDKQNVTPELDGFLNSLKVGNARTHKNLTIYPVFSEIAGSNGYKLLDEAVKADLFLVTEVDHGGNVPELLVINKLDADVLILDGEELVGAKQNRIVNTTIIIAKGKETIIPVSCVEQGRWSYRGKRFGTSKWSLCADIRRDKAKAVKENLKANASFRSDQNKIWDKISAKSAKLDTSCETGAMGSMYESHDDELKAYEAAFPLQPEQIGFVACIDGRVEGCDILALKSVFPKIYGKMLRGYLLDAVERQHGESAARKEAMIASTDEIYAFFDKIKGSKKESFKSAGQGVDIRFDSAKIEGFALLRDGGVIHVAAFPDR